MEKNKQRKNITISGVVLLILTLLVFGRTTINQLENDLKTLTRQNKNLIKQLNNIHQTLDDKEITINDLKQQSLNLETKINQLTIQITKNMEKLSGHEMKINQIANNNIQFEENQDEVKFIKNGFSDWTKEINQDKINDSVAITRQNQGGLYNFLYSSNNQKSDPTLFWFIGSGPNDIQGPIKNSFEEALYGIPDYALNGIPDNDPLNLAPEIAPHPSSPNGLINDNIPVTLQIKNSDLSYDYYILKFIKWNGNFEIDENENRPGGGEFEYIRTKYQE